VKNKLRRKKGAGEYLAFLTVKYDIHPDMLFCAMLTAGETGKAKCGPLTIERRGRIDDKIYYLIKKGSEVVSQLPVSEEFLARQRNPIRNFMETGMVLSYKTSEPEKPVFSRIEDLKVGKNHVNLKAEVTEVSKPEYVNTQFGNRILLSKALLRDETGEIKLCLWKEQVNALSSGDQIEVENASVKKFRGKKQLTLGSKGTLKVVHDVKAEASPVPVQSEKM
jgi:replication factor A1